jgi:hypothetical protein
MKARRYLMLACAAAALPLRAAWAQPTPQSAQRFPDVLSAKVKLGANGTYDFDVTISSPYDSPQRYADAFRVTLPDGKPLGERILWHDHQNEQPFTRDLYGVKIPSGVTKVLIQARDQKFGYGGKQIEITLPKR